MINKLLHWFKKYRLHFLIWIAFISYEIFLVGYAFNSFAKPLVYVAHYTIILVLFYVHELTILPWALQKNTVKFWLVPLTFISECAAFIFISFWVDKLLIYTHVINTIDSFHITYPYILKTLYRAVYFMGFSTGYYYLRTYIREKKRSAELEKERLNEIIKRQKTEQQLTRAQNAFLKAQINPHFLFNTLDFVYHNVMETSPQAAEAIVTLAEMMRYAIDADKMGEFIIIGDEIEQVQNLQYLNRLRKNEDMPLKLIYPDEIRGISFIPLVLLTLAENIFKHGNLLNGQEAIMEIYIEKDLFIIKTDNVSSRQKPSTSHRTGLINIEQRLKYAYGDGAYFNYHQDDDGHFRLIIKVPVQQLQGAYATSPVLEGTGTI
jgi:two-component system, LytTR family, sensor kinase